MKIRKIMSAIAVAVAVQASYAQDESEPPLSSSNVNGVVEPIPAPGPLTRFNDMAVHGVRGKGLAGPMSSAVQTVYSLADSIQPRLSPRDLVLFDAARAASYRAHQHSLNEDACRLAVALSERGYGPADAAEFGRRFNEAQALTNERLVGGYYRLIDTLSLEGASLVENLRVSHHKTMGAIEYDWELQAQEDLNLVNRVARNCQAAQ